ncbi:hypothetical protein F4778DRAFT_429477 [Xylariomycetidae sp. FL2044]|nr:hypothetical protein F4778DRAFT_429477 [Xylariomycetidae sp. FL2044]
MMLSSSSSSHSLPFCLGALVLWLLASMAASVDVTAPPQPVADEYAWTFKWTVTKGCSSWPCPYSYDVSGPAYANSKGAVPSFATSCAGDVDKPLKACNNTPDAAMALSGNFSTYETSGVGSGVVAITARWFSDQYRQNLTLSVSTPLESQADPWSMHPSGCPLTDCPAPAVVVAPR